MKNKGFSLVELIIVIAIMAILAAAIAPALIRYIDKSRKADDVSAAETINTAVSAALANEDAYSEVATKMDGTQIATATPGQSFQANGSITAPTLLADVNSSCGGAAPKLKYTKAITPGGTDTPTSWFFAINANGKPIVGLNKTGGGSIELQPEINASYK